LWLPFIRNFLLVTLEKKQPRRVGHKQQSIQLQRWRTTVGFGHDSPNVVANEFAVLAHLGRLWHISGIGHTIVALPWRPRRLYAGSRWTQFSGPQNRAMCRLSISVGFAKGEYAARAFFILFFFPPPQYVHNLNNSI